MERHVSSLLYGICCVINIFFINDVLIHPSAVNQNDNFNDLIYGLQSALRDAEQHSSLSVVRMHPNGVAGGTLELRGSEGRGSLSQRPHNNTSLRHQHLNTSCYN